MNKKSNKLKIACIQINSKSNINKNLEVVEVLINSAIKKGAQFIATPENTNIMHPNKEKLVLACSNKDNTNFLNRIQKIAKAHSVWILLGSLIIKNSSKLSNRSYLINNKGIIISTYDKIHMFDVKLSDKETYNESSLYKNGKKLKTAKTPWAKVGLSICYDLRFPNMYRSLAKLGCKIIFIPSAFTKTTGKAHWLTLVKARAIENGCFIVAPAQYGRHYAGRETFGNSIIVSPWGTIVKIKKKGVGIMMAEINLAEVDATQRAIPSLKA